MAGRQLHRLSALRVAKEVTPGHYADGGGTRCSLDGSLRKVPLLRATKQTFVEGSRTPSRKRGPRRTVHASFPRTRLEHSIKRRTDAGLAVLRKPFANGTLLIHLIAETRALNRGLPVSLKLPRVESQMRACDNCTTRKSASFQIRAKLEPLCNPLQAALRFFRVLIPTCPTASLASRLP
jgi:hypothetical protein